MRVEIERKFLVEGDGWRRGDPSGERFCQGYLAERRATVRVRRAGNRASVTIKGQRRGIARPEFEYLIPVDDAEQLLAMCRKPLIEKTRYSVRHNGHKWAVDVFDGDNAGLVLAEIELRDPEERFERPDWLGPEVTHNPRYRNSTLSMAPINGAGDEHCPSA